MDEGLRLLLLLVVLLGLELHEFDASYSCCLDLVKDVSYHD